LSSKPKKLRKPLILLGAGASKPAGVPTATEMTVQMTKRCSNTEFQRPLRAIVGALHMQQAHSGRQVDVEQVMNASVLLADRLSLEFAPFVGAWHPIIDDLERKRLDRPAAEQIAERAMGWRPLGKNRHPRDFSERAVTEGKLQRAIAAAILAMGRRLDQRPNGALFRQLSAHLTGLLIDIAWLKDPERLSYLDPLIKLGKSRPITVATLNYDNAIELRANAIGVDCKTGLAEWSSTGSIPKFSRGIQLLKLHGSVNWKWQAAPGFDHSLTLDRKVVELPEPNADEGDDLLDTKSSRDELAVLFGGRNKLTAEGPFLDLLVRFKSDLFQSNTLVVIGYSFRDPHINHYILRWLHSGRGRRMYIVDAAGVRKNDHPFFEGNGDAFGRRVTLITGGAKVGITTLFG
jgi:hypothetical protein